MNISKNSENKRFPRQFHVKVVFYSGFQKLSALDRKVKHSKSNKFYQNFPIGSLQLSFCGNNFIVCVKFSNLKSGKLTWIFLRLKILEFSCVRLFLFFSFLTVLALNFKKEQYYKIKGNVSNLPTKNSIVNRKNMSNLALWIYLKVIEQWCINEK